MPFDPSNSAIKVDRTLEEKLKGASHEEIKEIMSDAARSQGLYSLDWDGESRIPVENATAPQKVGKVIVLNGVKHSLVADDEAGLLAQETAIYRSAMQPTETRTEPTRDASTGRFTAAEPVATDEQKAALSLQFSLGQISASEYIERSGAVSDYLEKQGIPIEELREQVQEKQ